MMAVALLCLISAVALMAVGSLGLFVCGDAFDRLHATTSATIFAPGLVAVGLVASEGIGSGVSIRGILTALVLAGTGPILSHATARAQRLRQRGDLEIHDDEALP